MAYLLERFAAWFGNSYRNEIKIKRWNRPHRKSGGSRKKNMTNFLETFGAQIVYYSDLVLFKQKFKLKNNSKPANVVAEITYQTCDDRVCLAPNTLEFEQKVVNFCRNCCCDKRWYSYTNHCNKWFCHNKSNWNHCGNSYSDDSNKQEGLKISSIDHENPLTDCGVAKQKNNENFGRIYFSDFSAD